MVTAGKLGELVHGRVISVRGDGLVVVHQCQLRRRAVTIRSRAQDRHRI
jgi:hypothetical protein